MLDPHFDGAKRQRVFRALEWFRLSHTDLDEVSNPNRLVMMATAFEIVLQFPRWSGKKKEFFVDQIERIVAGGRLDAPSSNLSIVAGKWAGDFYKLRGDIVHGDPVSSQDLIYREWITHLVVVDLIFWECLVLLLVQWGVYQTGAEEVIEEWSKAAREHLTHVFLGFDNIHRALGWLPPL